MEVYPKITLKILQVLHGDAICVRFLGDDKRYHNLFIDGGFPSTYSRTLKKEAERAINANEKVDLFTITHTDRDHIGGVIQFIKDYGETDLVNKYWFNYSNLDIVLSVSNDRISIADGIKLRDYLKQSGKLPGYEITDEICDFESYGAKLTVLSPLKSELENYKTLWYTIEKEQEQEKLIASEGSDYDYSIDRLSENNFREDRKLENRVSIAFLFQAHSKSIFFLADSHPSTIVSALKVKGYSSRNRLKVDFVKLSHHASKFNTNDELLSLIDCNSFVISANGKNRYHFPHKEPLARILTNSERDFSKQITFIFNYGNEVLRSIFTENEQIEYNFLCLYPNENENGFTIYL